MTSKVTGTSLWRMAGMSYLQYINRSASILRASLKEPLKTKNSFKDTVSFSASKWVNGERGPKVEVHSIQDAGKAFKSVA